jgi:hypothetical protein
MGHCCPRAEEYVPGLDWLDVTIAYCKTYWFSESIQSKVLSEASTILKVMALQST